MTVEGPRAIRPEERASLRAMLNSVFRPGRRGDMFGEYMLLFREGNLAHLTVMLEQGEVVSHVGMAVRWLSFEGVALKVGLIGAVATAERCRGRGYATQCMDAALATAAEEEVDVTWISGGRGLYTSRGAATVGKEWVYHVGPGGGAEAVTVREMVAADIDAAQRLHRGERVRFLREREDWASAFEHGFAMNRTARFWGVWRGPELSAYLITQEQQEQARVPLVAEFGGDREDAARALPKVAARMGIKKVQVHVADWDEAGRRAFGRAARDAGVAEAARGLFLPVRMAACMERLRPRIAECCAERVARGAEFSESGIGAASREGAGDRLTIRLDGRHADVVGRAEVAKLLFGTPDGIGPAVEGDEDVMDAVQAAFPLPTPWYGLNFV